MKKILVATILVILASFNAAAWVEQLSTTKQRDEFIEKLRGVLEKDKGDSSNDFAKIDKQIEYLKKTCPSIERACISPCDLFTYFMSQDTYRKCILM